ncbi:serine hydrolase [Chryseolinea sp. T2]|uniref:serine hydrolase n=1 Tax=Chryseolinea sp. T2 TaxID=3129255 RepID=UPI003077EBC7
MNRCSPFESAPLAQDRPSSVYCPALNGLTNHTMTMHVTTGTTRIWLFCAMMIFALSAEAQWKDKIREVDSVLTYLHERQLFNGTVLLAEKGKVIYTKAFGINRPAGKPLTTTSSFNLASVSKQFYAMMVMMLKEEKKLSFDDDVQKHLPGFPYTGITLRNLMNHTSGLPEYLTIADRQMNLMDTLTNEEMLAILASRKPAVEFKTGERFQYCNTNYTTLASVIEKVSGTTCDKFFSQRIAKPLGMNNSFIYDLTMKTYPASRVWGFRFKGGKPVLDDLVAFDGIVGDGNVYSSVEDLLKWDLALYGSKLVSQSTLAEAFKPATLNDGTTSAYGFGWNIDEVEKSFSHSGGYKGFRALIERKVASRQTFIILDNSSNFRAISLLDRLLDSKPYGLPVTQLIKDVEIMDGTGLAAYKGAVRIVDDRIGDIGDLHPFKRESVVDGKGYVLAPGFIDSHSHHERDLSKNPEGIAAISQGITTIVIGQDGGSDPIDSLKARISRRPASVNIATYTGHASLREMAMDNVYRKADTTEIGKMKRLLADEMKEGSLGLSTGLEYEEGFYATRDEVIDLAKVAAANHGRYISHMRSEDINIERAVEEIIDIGKTAKIPVQISHLKIAMRSKWGDSRDIIARLERARAEGIDITADVYPYSLWVSTPRVLFPKKDFTNEVSARYATDELFDPSQSVILAFDGKPAYVGKTFKQIATMNNESESATLMRIIRESESDGATMAGASMSEEDISNFLKWEHSNVCSDGYAGGHPRGYGSFPRVLGYYGREKKLFPLETAIYKMTGLSAEHLGISDRGVLAQFNYADMVLFNPAIVKDNATMKDPSALSTGIEIVWVNGRIVYMNHQTTHSLPGMFVGNSQNE